LPSPAGRGRRGSKTQSLATAETFTNLLTKAGLLEKKGDAKTADALRTRSLQLATETEMNAYGY